MSGDYKTARLRDCESSVALLVVFVTGCSSISQPASEPASQRASQPFSSRDTLEDLFTRELEGHGQNWKSVPAAP